jgi:hypothetical protein
MFGTKLMLGLLVAVVALTLMQCTVKKPEAPTWDTQFTLPLVNRTYGMVEIIDKIDQEGISIDADSGVIFSVSEDIDTVLLDADELTTADLSYSLTEQLGPIDLAAPVVPPTTLLITQVGGLATYLPGVVPATSFAITPNLPTISSLSSANVTSGAVYVVVDNDLGFEITAESVELWDLYFNHSLGYQTFSAPIPNGGVDSVRYDLGGQTISNDFEVRITASTPGGTVLSTADKSITTTVRFDGDITVSAATAEIPALSRSYFQAVELGESDLVYSATLSSGTVQLSITNLTNLSANLDVTLPDIIDNGQPLRLQPTVGPSSTQVVTADLEGYDVQPADLSVPQNIRVEIVAAMPGSGSQHVAISQSNQFLVTASLRDLTFGTVTGLFSSVGSTLEPSQHHIEVPDGFDSVQMVSAVLTLKIDNGVELSGNLDLTISGNNGKTLNILGSIAPGTSQASVMTNLIDSTVADFLSPLPSQITISGSASFGDGFSVGTISAGDFVHAGVEIIAPFEVIIPETSIEPDIESEEIDQDNVDAITDHVNEARLVYNVTNRLPIGVRVNLYLSGDSATVISNPQLSFIDQIFVTAAPTIGSLASDTVSTGEQVLVIDNDDIQILTNDTLYIGTELVLEDSNGLPVKLTAADWLKVTGRIEVEYRFDGEF